jgi:hypothetical protein
MSSEWNFARALGFSRKVVSRTSTAALLASALTSLLGHPKVPRKLRATVTRQWSAWGTTEREEFTEASRPKRDQAFGSQIESILDGRHPARMKVGP